ncbi:hypothetical protein [Natronospira bacteriovora]|uniref:DUF3619 family protein n=1 Tax=Natronospira bacteriovora TaxID=3069753 RepID=A0ABU0WAF3_9GAMM|nr:hypothetical protein [Natronospira sp. AB-CW4]MDQ2069930.1 hypothetical protein [Natronospira sp. AB-CW4]
MSEHDKDDALIRALSERFDAGLDSVSEFDRARLRRARQKALAAQPPARRGWVVPAALAASVALMALLTVPFWSGEPVPAEEELRMAEQEISDLEILLAEDELSLYADLDFYVWLEAELADEAASDAS